MRRINCRIWEERLADCFKQGENIRTATRIVDRSCVNLGDGHVCGCVVD